MEKIELNINEQGVAQLTLNRPEVSNALDAELIQQFIDALTLVRKNSAIKVLLLNGNGKNFCAGADINWMRNMVHYSREENERDAQQLACLMRDLYEFPIPTIAIVQGAVYGGGIGLVACCDLAVADRETIFCLSEVKLGLIPAVISPYVIRAIGQRYAQRYFLTAEAFDAKQSLQLGLIHEIENFDVMVPHDIIKTVQTWVRHILHNGPNALKKAKELILNVSGNPLNEALMNYTAKTIADLRIQDEAQTRLHLFLEKNNV